MKFSKYSTILRGKSYLLHNAIYGTVIRVNDIELKKTVDRISCIEEFQFNENDEFQRVLKQYNFIIDNEIDEQQLLNLEFRRFNRNVLQIIIIVTRKCNFRCPYCYENHENNYYMEDGTYNDIITLIHNLVNKFNYNKIIISFFGGEPLLEYKKILQFMKNINKLYANKVEVVGSMTTNGYLLDIDSLKELVKENVMYYQITVDGLQSTHDTSRILVNKRGTWKHIIDNLIKAKNSKLHFDICIRTNFTPLIEHDINNYLEWLYSCFGDDNRFKYHFESVKNLGGDIPDDLELSKTGSLSGILHKAKKHNFNVSTLSNFINIFGMVCYAASENCFIIDYDGAIRKCTVHLDDPNNYVGSISNNNISVEESKLASWTDYELNEDCNNCSILPLCMGRRCPAAYYDATYCKQIKLLYEDALRYKYNEI